jgi:hypothetical protein
MQEPITYVGVDAHKGELHVAMLIGYAAAPTTWIVTNERRVPESMVERFCKVDAPGCAILERHVAFLGNHAVPVGRQPVAPTHA